MAESDKKKILATIFCLKEDSAYDDKARFNEFWGDVEDCEIFDNETEKWSDSNFHKSLNKGNNKITELRTILQRESPNS